MTGRALWKTHVLEGPVTVGLTHKMVNRVNAIVTTAMPITERYIAWTFEISQHERIHSILTGNFAMSKLSVRSVIRHLTIDQKNTRRNFLYANLNL